MTKECIELFYCYIEVITHVALTDIVLKLDNEYTGKCMQTPIRDKPKHRNKIILRNLYLQVL